MMSMQIDNRPDLIVAVPQDDQYVEKNNKELEKCPTDHLAQLQLEKCLLQCEIDQLRSQLIKRQMNDEFDDQSQLLKQRFQNEIQSILIEQTQLIEQTTNDFSTYVIDVLRQTFEGLESLRLLHQKELLSLSKNLSDCLQQQSTEMNELSQQLLKQQQQSKSIDLLRPLTDLNRKSSNDFQTSFTKKLDYLMEIHSSTVETLKTKHERELNEIQCELNLFSQSRQ